MESLRENTMLFYSILISGVTLISLASGLAPSLSEQFELVEFPTEVNQVVIDSLL